MKAILVLLVLCHLAALAATVEENVEFVPGKRGLGMTGGYYRNAPVVEALSAWTASLWCRANSQDRGVLIQVVLDEWDDEKISLVYEQGVFDRPGTGQSRPWEVLGTQSESAVARDLADGDRDF